MTLGVLLLVAALVGGRSAPARLGFLAVGLGLVAGFPVALGVGAVAVGALAFRRGIRSNRERAEQADEELLTIDLIALGVGGGLTFHQAVGFAAASVGGIMRSRIHDRLRRSHHRHVVGLEPPAEGDPIEDVFDVAARSAASGVPLQPALLSLAGTARAERTAADAARLARLPVKLLFPLALLILPGFVLMTVGPTVISGLSRLTL